ncbi:MAG: translation initiation factor IF-2 N-terminal domain-containing protein, partial [Gemmatimonadota bacterium]|nr:translation initiation factor IF-2 N-terminal domain-containing protein [Gemmatimonadota bacterium]
MRVYEVAEELGLESSQLIQMLREMDILVRSHMSTVEPSQVARLHARLERERRGDLPASKTATKAPRRRRRRRRPAPPETATADASAEAAEEGAAEATVDE